MTHMKNKILKNTFLLYFRMLTMMVVNLYASRIVLQTLGINDFGLYDIIGGLVILFSFINNAMITSTQRFLNFELGRQNRPNAQMFLSASINLHLIIALGMLLIATPIGMWFLNHYISIPDGREFAANWVFIFTILSTCFNIIRTPYNAAIIAHEEMRFYAYISIAEAILKLLIVFILGISKFDRLILYAVLTCTVIFCTTGIYYAYCHKKFDICRYILVKDKQIYYKLTNFSGWSLFGCLANIGTIQGVNILLNFFFGVAINAAAGIANQINSALYQFVSNFQIAFNPQIVKSYAAQDKKYFINLILQTSKFSYFLMFTFTLPVFLCCQGLLSLWLGGTLPEHTVSFCQLLLLFTLLDAIQGPLWFSVQATGQIKYYQITVSLLILLNVPLSYYLIKYYQLPELAIGGRIFINLILFFYRVFYLRNLYGFPIRRYLKEVITKILSVSLISIPIPYLVYSQTDGLKQTIFTCIVAFLTIGFIIYHLGLTQNERIFIKQYISKITHNR